MSFLSRIESSNADGRAQSPRYIQSQLQRLYGVLQNNKSALRKALVADGNKTSVEVELELYLALDSIKCQYDSTDFEQVIKDEYKVARGEDAKARRVPHGIVYIVPAHHTLLCSVIFPASAAIRAGNCVVIELSNTLSELVPLLRRMLLSGLDRDTFVVVDSRPDSTFLSKCAIVDANSTIGELPSRSNTLISPSDAHVVAIVDRTADLESAARAIVDARISFGGRSPYAPDRILVNEFKIKEFTTAVVSRLTSYLADSVPGYVEGHVNGGASDHVSKPLHRDMFSDRDKSAAGVTVVLSGERGTVISVSKRDSKLLKRKINQPLFILCSVSSLDDAIDFANTTAGGHHLLATYHFAEPSFAKYTAHFINTNTSYINHIPLPLLAGPAAPVGHATIAHPRYSADMFSMPSPQYIRPDAMARALQGVMDKGEVVAVQEVRKMAQAGLRPTGQREGKAVAFFDQGLMLGGVIVLSPVLAGLGYVGYVGVKMALKWTR